MHRPYLRGLPRYELCEGTSNKFWEIELSGASFKTTYGRIGTAGQTTLKAFKSEAEAEREYDKIIAEKGYALVGGPPAAARPSRVVDRARDADAAADDSGKAEDTCLTIT
ncbi:MAG: WGR domain-containing protein [Kofleriaceae bacterium]